jgi:mono/diheme cytochrome c family protein
MAWMAVPATAQQQAAVSDQVLIGPGRTIYAQKCGHCHGPNMVTAGTVAPDLRAFPDDNARFIATVKQGKNNMPPWKSILTDQRSPRSGPLYRAGGSNEALARSRHRAARDGGRGARG